MLLVAAIALPPFVYSMPGHDGDKPKADQMEVSMAGTTDGEILVDVKISNEEAKRLILVIENDRGDELYKKEITKTGFHSRIKFPKDNYISEYTIKLKAGTRSLEQYKVTSTARVVYDVEIVKP
jgi:hypothetical protein